MIFISRNEDGIPAWQLILEGKKTVTRRLKPVAVGTIVAVQPGRGKKAVCRVRVKGCRSHIDWILNTFKYETTCMKEMNEKKEEEAKREGFNTWLGLMDWFTEHKINVEDTYRIEFELIKP